MLEELDRELPLRAEVVVDHRGDDAGARGDLGHRGVVVAPLGEDLGRGAGDPLTALGRRQPAAGRGLVRDRGHREPNSNSVG